MNHSLLHIMFMIFAGTALLSTMALFTRQSLLVAYIVLGALIGPWGLRWVHDSTLIEQTGSIGIIFLLFLLGLHLQPQNLWYSLRKMSWITAVSSVIFLITGFIIMRLFGYSVIESTIIGATMMFSSTIIGLKLLPTTILHHQHTGELMISILLLQDLIAIALLLILQGIGESDFSWRELISLILAFPILLTLGYVFERYILGKLLAQFDKVHEYIFILSIGWCLSMAELAHFLGLSEEIGAFIAGVALATSPISLYIAESLKPLRDFFLVIFFFTVGAGFDFEYFSIVIWPALALAASMLLLKPLVYAFLLRRAGEPKKIGWEIGVRLGQVSEFSLLVVYMALEFKFISPTVSYIVEAATIITFIVSCYWVVLRYPTPLASTDKLRRD